MNEHIQESRAALFAQRFSELTQGDTCRELAEKLGISRSAIWAYQNGTRMPKIPALGQIARAYGVDPLWLMGGDVDKYAHPLPANV